MKRWAVISTVVVALGALLWQGARAVQTARLASFEKAREDSTVYYRVRSSYRVKETDEPLDFDYVVNCSMRRTTWKDGDSSYDLGGFSPEYFILATREKHAVMMRTPFACSADYFRPGIIPADLFPMIYWFDDVEDMRFGWGYSSEDAYENPNGHLVFKGATLTPVAYADWQAWKDKAAENFKPIGRIVTPWGHQSLLNGNLTKDDIANHRWVAVFCAGYVRTTLVPAAREVLRKEWEARGKPQFWMKTDKPVVVGEQTSEDSQSQFAQSMPRKYPDGSSQKNAGRIDDGGDEWALPTRAGGGTVNYSSRPLDINKFYGAPTYPTMPFEMSSDAPRDPNAKVWPRRVLLDDAHKGFTACGWPTDDPDSHLSAARDDPRFFPFYINDVLIAGNNRYAPRSFFERDEFAYGVSAWGAPHLN